MPAKKHSTSLVIIGIVAALALAAAIILLKPAEKPAKLIDTIPRTASELLYNDVLAGDFVSTNITVLGVTVGMNEDDVLAKLGPADNAESYDFGAVKNWMYGPKLGLNGTAVLYHFERETVTRIVVLSELNEHLNGTTRVGKSKAQVYSAFGVPDRQYDFSRGRFFVYNPEGFEVYLKNDVEYQYAFVYPMRKLPPLVHTTKNKSLEEFTTPATPILITDTTTLCDQGVTFGQEPETGECKWFRNSCEIPDYWVEVSRCEGNSTR